MSRFRNTDRINYAVLNSTGERTILPEANTQPQLDPPSLIDDNIETEFKKLTLDEMSKPSELIMDTNVIIAEIKDVLDENPVHHDLVSNFDSVTSILQTLRMSLRQKEQRILVEAPNHPLATTIPDVINQIKLHKQKMIECKSKVDVAQTKLVPQNTGSSTERSIAFAIQDISFKIKELQKEFTKSFDNLSHAELLQMKSDLPMLIRYLLSILLHHVAFKVSGYLTVRNPTVYVSAI